MLKYQNEIFETLKKAMRFHSKLNINTSDTLRGMPFGRENRECLDYVLGKCKELGFRTKNASGYYGYAEYGHGDDLVGVFCHLDVVPAGDRANWHYEPYRLTIHGNYMYGRGISDAKGPAIISIYAIKSLIDEGVIFNKRVRLFFGMNEETGFRGIKLYNESEEAPIFAISPEGVFPVAFGEKGNLSIKARVNVPNDFGFISLQGGNVTSIVCDNVILKIKMRDLLETSCKYYKQRHRFFDYSIKDGVCKIEVSGKACHASTPDKGENAISRLFKALEDMGFTEDFITDYNDLFSDYYGKGLNCNFKDEYGNFTVNIGSINSFGNRLELDIETRYPVTIKEELVVENLTKSFAKTTYHLNIFAKKEALLLNIDNTLVKICQEAYEKVTKDYQAKPQVLALRTYAKFIDNCVAVGGAFPKANQKIHQPDEECKISEFFQEGEIIKEIVKQLLAR